MYMYVGEEVQCYWFLYARCHLHWKGFAYRFSHDSHLDIDREVLTAYTCTAGGLHQAIVLILGLFLPVWLFSDWCITILAHGCWVQSNALLALLEVETVVVNGFCVVCRYPCLRHLSSTISCIHQLIIIFTDTCIMQYLYFCTVSNNHCFPIS